MKSYFMKVYFLQIWICINKLEFQKWDICLSYLYRKKIFEDMRICDKCEMIIMSDVIPKCPNCKNTLALEIFD